MTDSGKEETTRQTAQIQDTNKNETDTASKHRTEHPTNNGQGNVIQNTHRNEDLKNTEEVVCVATGDTHGSSAQESNEGTQPVVPETQHEAESSSEEQRLIEEPPSPSQQVAEGAQENPQGSTTEGDGQRDEEGEGRGKDGGRVAAPGKGWQEERVGRMVLFGVPIVSLHVEGQERLCLAQISASLLHVSIHARETTGTRTGTRGCLAAAREYTCA